MMDVTRREIRSEASPDNRLPWYDIEIDGATLTVNTDGDGRHEPDVTGESIGIDTSQDSVVAVAKDGGLVSYPQGDKDAPELRAHLAWYDATADVLTVLKFVEL